MELQQHFMISKVEEMDEHYRDKVNTSIIGDVDVQYYIDCVTEDLEEEEKKELLQQIESLYVTVVAFPLQDWRFVVRDVQAGREKEIAEVKEPSQQT